MLLLYYILLNSSSCCCGCFQACTLHNVQACERRSGGREHSCEQCRNHGYQAGSVKHHKDDHQSFIKIKHRLCSIISTFISSIIFHLIISSIIIYVQFLQQSNQEVQDTINVGEDEETIIVIMLKLLMYVLIWITVRLRRLESGEPVGSGLGG